MIPKKELIVKLRPDYRDAVTTQDPKEFAFTLFRVLDTCDQNGDILFHPFKIEEINDKAPLQKLEKKLMKEIKTFYHKRLEPYCRENNISLPMSDSGVPGRSLFLDYAEGRIVNTGEHLLETLFAVACNHLDRLEIIQPPVSMVSHLKKYMATKKNGDEVLMDSSLEFLDMVHASMSAFMAEHKLANAQVTNELNDYVKFKNSSAPNSHLLQYAALAHAVTLSSQTTFYTTRHNDFVMQYISVDAQTGTSEYTFAPSLEKWWLKKREFERIHKSKIWRYSKPLQEFYDLYKNYERTFEKVKKNRDYMLEVEIKEGMKKIDGMVNGMNPAYQQELVGCLKKIWGWTKSDIAIASQAKKKVTKSLPNTSKEDERPYPPLTCKRFKSELIVYCGERSIPFGLGTQRAMLSEPLIKKKQMSVTEALEIIEEVRGFEKKASDDKTVVVVAIKDLRRELAYELRIKLPIRIKEDAIFIDEKYA